MSTLGYGIITPRWLFVMAQATPTGLVGDPVIIDETIKRFNATIVNPGDIVGIGISTGNCIPGYRVVREAKLRGATVIVGGVHATIFPDEPLEMGADAVVTGNGDVVWKNVVRDALDRNLRKQYCGGRVPGDALLKARWDLLDPTQYLLASIQTVAGCPENCSFCSTWITEGRQPRQRLTDKIIEEANELYGMGFRYIVFADDNFNPATLGRIAREPSKNKKRELERVREERLGFFDEYVRSVPENLYGFTQMTSEIISDDEYLSAMYHKMHIRTACIGVESFSQQGLESANKQWNPVGQKMVETIQKIQERGVLVLSSIICGLESDTIQTLRTMRNFVKESGTILAQFTFYKPYPGTKDYHEMMSDFRNRGNPLYVPKHKSQILHDKSWLRDTHSAEVIKHPNLSANDLIQENKRCWDTFYSLREILKRTRGGVPKSWPLAGKITYVFLSLVFKRVFSGQGITADSVRKRKLGIATRMLVRITVGIYGYCFRQKKIGLRVPWLRPKVS
jgi:radical SAM superfamily enzyme YgiQ (UPF0313 family)